MNTHSSAMRSYLDALTREGACVLFFTLMAQGRKLARRSCTPNEEENLMACGIRVENLLESIAD